MHVELFLVCLHCYVVKGATPQHIYIYPDSSHRKAGFDSYRCKALLISIVYIVIVHQFQTIKSNVYKPIETSFLNNGQFTVKTDDASGRTRVQRKVSSSDNSSAVYKRGRIINHQLLSAMLWVRD